MLLAIDPSLTAPAVCELDGPVMIGEITSNNDRCFIFILYSFFYFNKDFKSIVDYSSLPNQSFAVLCFCSSLLSFILVRSALPRLHPTEFSLLVILFARCCRILHFVVVCYALANLVSLVQNYASCNFACKSLHSALKMFHFQSLHRLFCFIVLVALQSSHWQNYAKKKLFLWKRALTRLVLVDSCSV